MADAVTSEYIYSGKRRKILHLTGISDGTGESGVVKADISTLTFNRGETPTYTTVDMIDYAIQGHASIRLHWDHDTDDEIAVLPAGVGTIHFGALGGKTDPRTTGGTGDIILTTNGHSSGDTYVLVLYFRPKA
jgi:hypothetical protein